jgi:hypothetical protein
MRGRLAFASVLFLLTAVTGSARAQAKEPLAPIPADLVLERFTIATDGDAIIVPVHFNGEDHPFVVDTGSTHTLIDSSLPVGAVRSTSRFYDAEGADLGASFHDCPTASVGHLPLRCPSAVVCKDLEWLRRGLERPVEGILGMDFLGEHVFRVDFVRAELTFLKTVPEASGDWIPIDWKTGDYPWIPICFSAEDKGQQFIVDTGYMGRDSGSLEIVQARGLHRKGEFREIGTESYGTLGGDSTRRVYQGKRMWAGAFAVEEPILSETTGHSALGLGFLSRFVVTFDFPRRRLYLTKSQYFDRPDRRNLSGLHLETKGGEIAVTLVDQGSPGAKAGIQPGDVVLQIGTLRAVMFSMYKLTSPLFEEGRVDCIVRRGSREHRLTLDLSR